MNEWIISYHCILMICANINSAVWLQFFISLYILSLFVPLLCHRGGTSRASAVHRALHWLERNAVLPPRHDISSKQSIHAKDPTPITSGSKAIHSSVPAMWGHTWRRVQLCGYRSGDPQLSASVCSVERYSAVSPAGSTSAVKMSLRRKHALLIPLQFRAL